MLVRQSGFWIRTISFTALGWKGHLEHTWLSRWPRFLPHCFLHCWASESDFQAKLTKPSRCSLGRPGSSQRTDWSHFWAQQDPSTLAMCYCKSEWYTWSGFRWSIQGWADVHHRSHRLRRLSLRSEWATWLRSWSICACPQPPIPTSQRRHCHTHFHIVSESSL